MHTALHLRRFARCAFLWAAATLSLSAAAQPGIDTRLSEAFQTDAIARVLVTVASQSERDNDFVRPLGILRSALGESGARMRRIGGLPVVLTEIDETDLSRLRSDHRIASIFLDKPERLTLDVSGGIMNVAPVHDQGFTGAGYAVAVLDTGVDASHDFLAGKVVAEACFSSPDPETRRRDSLCPNGLDVDLRAGAAIPCDNPADECAHGTHVAGIAAGLHMDTAAFGGSGIAKGSDLVAMQVFTRFYDPKDCQGETPCIMSYPSDQLEALEYVRFLHAKLPIASVNMSVGGDRHEQACDASDPRAQVIAELRTMGIATAISSGNDGFYNAVSAPGCISSALTVGAARRNSMDLDTTFSNTSDLVDFIAPGTDVMSSTPSGFAAMTGTSMAAPHIAGSIALLRSQYPKVSIDRIERALKLTSHLTDDPRTGMALKFPHVAEAAKMLQIASITDQPLQAVPSESFAPLLGATRIIIIPMASGAVSKATVYDRVKAALRIESNHDDDIRLMVKTSGNIVAERAQGFDARTLRQIEETLLASDLASRMYVDTPEVAH